MTLAWKVTYTVRDRKNKVSFVNYHVQYYDDGVPAYSTFANVESVALDIAPFVDGMINGYISNISVTRDIALPVGIKTSALSSADVEEKGVFVFRTTYSNPRVTIPTIKDSLIVDGTDVIDTSDADVAGFIFRMIDGTGSPSEFYKSSDNRDDVIFAYEDAYERFKKSGK